jgi:catechol 2,3-dioxygenase-like lactoylglutathione lyase family enzyme
VPVVRYLVDDVDEALAFYELLGFTLADRWGRPFAIVDGNGLSIWLSGPGTSARKNLADGSVPVPGGWNRVVVDVTDIEQKIAALKARGARFRSAVVTGPGGSQVVVDDPSGNPIELFEPRSAAQ